MPLPIVTTFVTVIDTNLPAAVPLSALLPSITVPTAVIPALASDLGPLISQLGSNLPSAMPVLMSLGSMLNSEASGAAIPEVQSLTALIASEVASLTQEVLSATVLVPTVLPVMSLELPSSTIAIPVPTSLAEQLAGLSLPTGAPLSELAATLSGIVGSDNSGLIDSIVGAIVSTLDGMVLSSQVNSLNSLIGGIPVAAGSVISAVTQEFCSQLSMVGGSMITIAVPCDSGSTATTSSGDSSAGASPVFPGAMSASVTITGPPLSELSVSVWTTMTASPSTTTAVSTTITGSPPISQTVLTTITLPPVSVTFSSSGIASSSSGPTLMTVSTTTLVVTVTNVEISTVTTCPAATSTASLTCPKLPPCPSCPITLACPSGTDIGGSNTDASSSGICSVSTDTGNGGSLVPSRTAGSNPGPCPGEGYTCDDCVDGWFCPPPHTSAQPAPCGYGWPCYHCAGGWFCVPSATLAPTTVTVCPLSVPGNPTPHTTTVAYMTLTSTAMVVIPEPPLPSETLHPALAGWKYAGCYKDDEYRALKNSSVTTAVVGGMTNEKCIVFCNNQGFGLAGTEDAYQCFCGDFLVDSWLLADSDCDSTCESDASSTCGGRWALSVWSPDGHVPMAIGPEEEFVMPTPTPGQTEMSVVTGGVRQTIIQITTPVFEFPAPETMTDMDIFPMTGSALTYATKMLSGVNQLNVDNINVEDIASTVHAIVSAAMAEAQQIAAAEVAKANSMVSGAKNIVGEGFEKMAAELNGVVAGAFPERIAWTTCSTTITSCSSTTTLSTTMTCTTSSPTTTSPSSGGSAAPVGNQPSVSSPTSSTVPGTLSTPDSTVTVSELTVTIGPSGTGSAAPVQLSTTSPSSSSLPSSPTSGIGTTPTSTPLSGAASAHPIGLSVTPFSTSAATSPGLSTPFPSLDHGSSPDNPSGTASVPTSAQTGQTPTATTLSISTPSLDHGSAPTNNPSPSLDHGNAPTESLSPSLDHGSAPTDNPSGVNSAAPVWNTNFRSAVDRSRQCS
ncbi:hypothetical protein B0T17DRAFT_117967 [Bombardia bombarda]|uniref:WSC domain-containing protein n=1 Tax=Bombardia bombarda TaxID=252184 RepID=A0AA39TKH1_9PEZI|nr:hypothetical protein B0T17DRAFT_117967 [Bombardia bombarda]